MRTRITRMHLLTSSYKPQRGGLFIDGRKPNNPSFCFSAARRPTNPLRGQRTQRKAQSDRKPHNRAAEKQKESFMVRNLAINRPPLWGLGQGACAYRLAHLNLFLTLVVLISGAGPASAETSKAKSSPIDFNREVRPILTENCFKCHGPDEGARKAKLRFDVRADALKPAKSGQTAIVPGAPEKSEMVARVTATDLDDRMPPLKSGKKLSAAQIETLRRWITQGAPYATHWSYVKPSRPALPVVKKPGWPHNAVDRFILARLERDGLKPSPQADRWTLIRRASLDLTGLPPTPDEVDQFVKDRDPHAYENLVDRLLRKDAFGEHWARMWLDLARYADSAGYADDPMRTIWAYRDYVIEAFNSNKPFDRFTLEQLAGDLFPDATEEDEVATAFHRNTMTNSEGGTDDEEFRNAAVVDRVNTTMSVWMATTMGCAQCHDHKYDPISQQEYFRFLAFFNNTQDADLNDESPVLQLYTPEQKAQRTAWQKEIAEIEKTFQNSTLQSQAAQASWEQYFSGERQWVSLKPALMKARDGGLITAASANALKLEPQQKVEFYTVDLDLDAKRVAGLRIEAMVSSQNPETGQELHRGFVISHVTAKVMAPVTNQPAGRYVRVELSGQERILSLAEVHVFKGGTDIALAGAASQSSTAFDGPARLAIDGNTDGDFEKKSTTHTEISENPWWEVDLKETQRLDRIVVWNRTDGNLQSRLGDFRIRVLNEKREPVWERTVKEPPNPSASFALDGSAPIEFVAAFADLALPGAEVRSVIQDQGKKKKEGWKVDPEDGKPHYLTLLPSKPLMVAPGSTLQVTIEQTAERVHAPATFLRISASEDEHISAYASIPESILGILALAPAKRDDSQRAALSVFYRSTIAPELKSERDRLVEAKKQLAEMKANTVPVMKELAQDKRRKTHIQFRGNYLALGDEVTEAVPATFEPLAAGAKRDRLTLAKWLVDENNPLTARVTANRLWEQIFGVGIVRTSEDFGSQGDRPTNPELLDWLACQLRDGDGQTVGSSHESPSTAPWDIKAFLKMLVTSAAYCQSSRVTPKLQERDPDNLLLARGPRFRMSAEVVRDQALAVSGLLSHKMYGPSVRPPRPSQGLSAAFGSSLDWKNSEGEDRYRRALYVEWRRTSPYPSMATFDAPNREVCALRRPRSNTPLQALVTLNDPVYIEAAQALAKRMAGSPGLTIDRARYGFRICLARPPRTGELKQLTSLYDAARAEYTKDPAKAKKMANDTGVAGEANAMIDLAAWTVVGNVLLNLDETLMRP